MKIEDIRLTPESLDWDSGRIADANAATDKAIREIVEFVDDYHSMRSNKFAQKYGRAVTYNEDGFALPIQVALKKLVEPSP